VRSVLLDLIMRVGHGDEAALLDLRRQTEPKLIGSIQRIVKNRWTVEEILQDVYTYVWIRAAHYDPDRGQPLAWLSTLCRSRAIDSFRRSKREALCMKLDDQISSNLGVSRQKSETCWPYNRLRESVYKLGPQQQHLIDLAFFEGFTHSEIAARTGIPIGTVKSRIRKALQQLKEALPV